MSIILRIGILTYQNGYKRGACDFYPLIKWDKNLKNEGLFVSYFSNHEDPGLLRMNVVIIDHRYYRRLTVIEKKYPDLEFILELISELKKREVKIVLFDNSDGSGSDQFAFIKYVDTFVKKQVLKNRRLYLENNGILSRKPFLKGYKLNLENKRDNNDNYVPCPEKYLYKIKVGWNIGMLDYRRIPFSKYLPIGTSRLFNSLLKGPNFQEDIKNKLITSTFRGQVKSESEIYSFQRNKVIETFKKKNSSYVTGGIIPRKEYLKELRQSKTCVSPFGWGEICYRDFEAIIAGCLLIKPDMDHIETYPDIYRKGETYLPLKWNMTDLEDTLKDAVENYQKYTELIKNAQRTYKKAISNSQEFIHHFKSIIE
jgi:hypothetical protein